MYIIIRLLKRRQGISFERFGDHYERHRAPLGQKYFGHLLLKYQRNYVLPAWSSDPFSVSFGYDCITEWVLPSTAVFNEVMALLHEPRSGQTFREDEEHVLDRTPVALIRCNSHGTGSGFAATTRAAISNALCGPGGMKHFPKFDCIFQAAAPRSLSTR